MFGSTAVTKISSPKTRASPLRMAETAVTPGVTATAESASFVNGSKPFWAVMA
jgi:hypothetical protein